MNIIILGFICVQIYVAATNTFAGGGIANKYFLEKQKFIFEILQHVQVPLLNEELIKAGQDGLNRDPLQYMEFNKLMEDFDRKFSENRLLHRHEQFSMANKESMRELRGLFYILYNAKDWQTLKQNICWARLHVHPQIFVFALTQTILKREDFSDLILPKVHEIWPYHFYEEKYITKLESFNYEEWNRQNFLYRNCITEGPRWCPQRRSGEIFEDAQKMVMPLSSYGNLRNSSRWWEALEEVSIYNMPEANTKDGEDSYLLKDKDWHSYWYYLNMGLWLQKDLKNTFTNQLRDWWFWNLQQMVTRHQMAERSATSKEYSHRRLIDFRGMTYGPLESKEKISLLKWLQDLHFTTQTALAEQSFQGRNQTQLTLNYLANFEEFLSQHFDMEHILKAFIYSGSKQNLNYFHNFETILRDDDFFVYAEILVNLYKSLKTAFDPHKPIHFVNEGIKLNSVSITELRTYFEVADADVTNLLRPSHLYIEGRLLWSKSLMLRQKQLQHQPFTIWFNVSSDKPQAVVVRSFMQMVECSGEAVKCPPIKDYLHLDTFVSNLAKGYNIIERHSREFYAYTDPSLSYTELYNFAELALDERLDFPLNLSTGNCRFPHHLMLPRGVRGEGLPIRLVFVAIPYNYGFHKAGNLNCDFSDGVTSFDNLATGFPFDRDVQDEDLFGRDNMSVKKVKIYHDDEVK